MSKQRAVNTKFWSDPWVRDELNPLDRYLFLYFLTNEHTNISGVYELPLATLAFETGLDKEVVEKTMLKRLRPKVIYHKSWVIIPKFPRHQNLKSDDVIKGILREFESAPPPIREEAIHRGWGDGLGMMPGTKPNLTKLISVADAPQVVEVSEEEERPKTKPKYPNAKAVFSWFPKPEKSWQINTTECKHAELLFERGEEAVRGILRFVAKHKEDEFFPKVVKPSDLERKWADIAAYKI